MDICYIVKFNASMHAQLAMERFTAFVFAKVK